MQQPNNLIAPIRKKVMPKYIIYLLVFLFTLHITPGSYIDSSFLEQFVGGDNVGYIFSFASLLTLILFIVIRRMLVAIGNYKTFLIFLLIDFVSLIILSLNIFFSESIWPYIFIIFYITSFVAKSICFLNLDIFLEHITDNDQTGGVRGFYLTSLNTAFIIGPLIAGLIITSVADAGKIYLLSWIILVPVIMMTVRFLNGFRDSYYRKSKTVQTIAEIYARKNLRNIFVSNFLLRFFYSWMIIYMPIFLTQFIGFSLGETALIISIALIPFVLFQLPMGKIADEWLGEKEILTAGFIIMGLTTASMTFLSSDSFVFWASLLFVTRIGASMVEIMLETHLFKKINDDSVNILSLFRAARPVAYIISPIIASVLLIFLEINYLFLILGSIVLLGIIFSLTIKDSK